MSVRGIGRPLAIAASLAVAITVVAALVVMEPPSVRREVKLDERRVRDLHHIVRAVEDHMQREQALPPDLATLAAQPGRRLPIVDPVSGAPYGYEVTGERAYRLCADFATDTATTWEGAGLRALGDWAHGTGRQCFDRRTENE